MRRPARFVTRRTDAKLLFRQVKHHALGLVCSSFLPFLLFSFHAAGVLAQDQPEGQQRLAFLVGHWEAVSEHLSTGQQTAWEVEFRWVMGGRWLLMTFLGNPEDGTPWDADAMVKYEPDHDAYKAMVFVSRSEPIPYFGGWVDENTLRFEIELPYGLAGVDYTKRPGGTVLQENWLENFDGTRTPTLRTTLTPWDRRRRHGRPPPDTTAWPPPDTTGTPHR